MNMMMIELDGSAGEGGGQVLRSSLALSMCTGHPVTLRNIRAKRPKPGLMRQHLTCVQAAQAVCGAEVEGAELGASTLVFRPGPVRAGDYRFSIGSAGSCTLVLQTVWPALMLRGQGESRVHLSGGTHNAMAPPFHFIERAYLPLLKQLGAQAQVFLHRHGFHPAGGGDLRAVIHAAGPQGLRPVDVVHRGEWRSSQAECLLAGVPGHVAQRQFGVLAKTVGWSPQQMRAVALSQNEGPGQALMATIVHDHVTEVFTGFGGKGLVAERVAGEVCDEIRAYLAGSAALGPFLADQWMLPLSLAVWQSGQPAHFTCSEISGHSSTHVEVISRFLPLRFDIEPRGPGCWHVTVAPA